MANLITCPHCGKEVGLSDALRHEIMAELQKQFDEKTSLEVADLKKALDEKDKKVQEMRDRELEIREEKRKLEERHKDFELEMQRKMDVERKKIEESVARQLVDEYRLKELEKDKKINDLRQALEDAQRKASQGSQQLQGEVLELDLELLLKESFPNDEIVPVGKGIKGADIKQIVKSPRGFICGVILWESKRTKAWSDGWISKLKEDLRGEKANVPIIVSLVTPAEAENGMGYKDGVWIVKYPLVLSLASLIRKNLLDIGYERAISAHRGEKADLLYEFVTGHEFRQQVESLAEVYNEMQSQLQKERIAFEKIWKTRETQIRRMVMATVNIYGSMQGLVGSSMPKVEGLEMFELEDGKD